MISQALPSSTTIAITSLAPNASVREVD